MTGVDLSFSSPDTWPHHMEGMSINAVLLGDVSNGPVIFINEIPPGSIGPPAPGHAHASDNFRLSLRGVLTMGRESYGPDDFRFQEGWKPYPNEGLEGEDGFWFLVMMADRRGSRRRLIREPMIGSVEEQEEIELHRGFATIFGLAGDTLYSDDPLDTAGPSAIVSSLGSVANSGKLNGSFSDTDRWPSFGTTRAIVTLLGHPVSGPIVIQSVTEPWGTVTPQCRFDTELFRVVVAGSCTIDGYLYNKGDMKLHRNDEACGPVVAGPEGLHEVLIIGDRRAGDPSVEQGVWLFGDSIQELGSLLAARIRERALAS